MRASTIIEFGTSFGVSTIYLAAALHDNGGGILITTEFESSKVERAREHLSLAGLRDFVELREGDALETLSSHLPSQVDLLLLDGAKGLYLDVLKLVRDNLRPGAVIVADDVMYCPDYLRTIRNNQRDFLTQSVAHGTEMTITLR